MILLKELFSVQVVNQVERARRSTTDTNDRSILDLESLTEQEAKSRRKRDFESHQHYIETLVVADASMVREHGDDLEHYIMTVMMIANRVFSHPSLGSAVALSVVKVSNSAHFMTLPPVRAVQQTCNVFVIFHAGDRN